MTTPRYTEEEREDAATALSILAADRARAGGPVLKLGIVDLCETFGGGDLAAHAFAAVPFFRRVDARGRPLRLDAVVQALTFAEQYAEAEAWVLDGWEPEDGDDHAS